MLINHRAVIPSHSLASVLRWPSGGRGSSQSGAALTKTHLKAGPNGPTSFPVDPRAHF